MKTRNLYFFLLILVVFAFLPNLPVKAEDYTLHIDDVLFISVWGHSDLQQEAVVSPDGTINFPLIGSIQAEGLSVSQLTENIKTKIGEYIKNPQISITLKSYRKISVMVLGEINRPGTYQLRADKRLLDVLALAGGPTETADLSQTRLTRGDNSQVLDLSSLLTGETSSGNYPIQEGDVLYIPASVIEVTIMGEVKNPGRYQLEKGLKLSALLARAGGLTPNSAETAKYTTDDQIAEINLEELMAGKLKSEPVLQEGDSVYIARVNQQVTIMGEVNRPGSYQWNRDLQLADLLAMAGNQTKRGDIERIKILHPDQSSLIVNLKQYFSQGEEGSNPSLAPGDIVMVEELKTSAEVTILGQVNRPGSYKWNENMQLAELLAVAGNQTERGNLEEVKILHKDNQTIFVNLKNYFNNGDEENNPYLKPGDIVMIEEIKTSAEVTILGEVNRPGSYEWNENLQLVDLLAMAGNQTKRGDIENIQLIHKDESSKIVNLRDFFQNADKKANPYLQPGDMVMIDELKTSAEVTILGEVNRPGAYEWNENLQLADLLARAGDQTERGNLEEVKVVSENNTTQRVNLKEYFQGANPEANLKLKPGDIVMIDELKTSAEVTILGEVNRPGSYKWNQNLRVVDLLAMAGNQTERGNIKQVTIIHPNGKSESIDLEKYFTDSGEGKNPLLEPGDIVKIEEIDSVNWPRVFNYVTGLKLIKDFLQITW